MSMSPVPVEPAANDHPPSVTFWAARRLKSTFCRTPRRQVQGVGGQERDVTGVVRLDGLAVSS